MRFVLLTFVAILLAFTGWASDATGRSGVVGLIGSQRAVPDSGSAAISTASSPAARSMGILDGSVPSPRVALVARGGAPARVDYRALARKDAADVSIDPALFERQIEQESGFDPAARSSAGAVGIAQIVPAMHPTVDPTDPIASLRYAAALMASYLDRYQGDYALALAAYNAGPGAVAEYGGVAPYAETRNYISSILGYW